jgi:hypothetical protein
MQRNAIRWLSDSLLAPPLDFIESQDAAGLMHFY